MNRLAPILVFVCVVATCLAAQQDQKSTPRRVVSADVAWTHDRGKPLLRGVMVQENELLSADAPGDVSIECNDGVRVYSCPKACSAGACADTMNNGTTHLVKLGRYWDALVRREPREPALAAARAGGNPSDAVVAVDDRGIHWGPALTRVLEGRYCLMSSLLPQGSAPAQSVVIEWDRATDPEGVVPSSTIGPGLYSVQKGTPNGGACQVDADGTSAWVLVVRRSDFAGIDAEWKKQAASSTELERAGASISTVSAVRHAILAGLADSIAAR